MICAQASPVWLCFLGAGPRPRGHVSLPSFSLSLFSLLAIVMLPYQPVFRSETKGLCGLTGPRPKAKLSFGPEHLSVATSATSDKHYYWYYLVLQRLKAYFRGSNLTMETMSAHMETGEWWEVPQYSIFEDLQVDTPCDTPEYTFCGPCRIWRMHICPFSIWLLPVLTQRPTPTPSRSLTKITPHSILSTHIPQI